MEDFHTGAKGQVLEASFPQGVRLPFFQLPAVADDVLQVAVEGLRPNQAAPDTKTHEYHRERVVWGEGGWLEVRGGWTADKSSTAAGTESARKGPGIP